MSYVVTSRAVYALPFLLYAFFHLGLMMDTSSFLYFALWIATFLFSMFFFGASKKILPLLLIHFVFLWEMFLYLKMGMATGVYQFFLFIFLSSYYTIESLRNTWFHMLVHLTFLVGGLFYINQEYGISYMDFSMDFTTFLILASPIVCRAIMSSMEERDVLLREVVTETVNDVYIPMEDTEKIKKLQQKVKLFKSENDNLKIKVTHTEQDNEELRKEAEEVRSQFSKLWQASMEEQEFNRETAKAYFSLLAHTRFDLSRTFEENLHNILYVLKNVRHANYIALVLKERGTENDDSYELFLADSIKDDGLNFSDDDFIGNPEIADYIAGSAERTESKFQSKETPFEALGGLQHIIYTPIAMQKDIRGVLVQCFDSSYKKNIHDFNLSLITAYLLYSVLQNENLYRQKKEHDSEYVDPLTGAYDMRYLRNNIQAIFNNIFNYGTNLACACIDVDDFKDVNGIYGEAVSDDILRDIYKGINYEIRRSDFLFRDGDKFYILMGSVTKEKLVELCRNVNIRLSKRKEKIILDGVQKNISVSMGAKIYDPLRSNVRDGNALISEAEKARDISKRNGKSKVTVNES